MFKNFIKTAYYILLRNYSQTIINVLGLAVGMTCALLIFLWVHNQINYDKWLDKSDRMCRVEYDTWVIMPPFIADHINDLPEVEDVVRLISWIKPTLSYRNHSYDLDECTYAESTFFNVFTFDFLYGNPEEALQNPASIVLTESMSHKIFGDMNPVGYEVRIDFDQVYTVTAVIEDVENLHLSFGAILPLQDLESFFGRPDFLSSRTFNYLIYALLKPNTDRDLLLDKIHATDFNERYDDGEEQLLLRPFEEIYFERNLPHDSGSKHGNYNLVMIFSAISFLILLIACINFINISTAKAKNREKEIGVRKIVGANRKSLIFQFMGETSVLVIIAHIISIVLLEFILPVFNNVTGESISFQYFSFSFLLTISTIILSTIALSGLYPAIYQSALRPVLMLKGKSGGKSSKGRLRKVLMTIQFAISIFLMIATIVIIKQLNFVLNKDLGWDQDNLITFEIKGDKFTGEPDERGANKVSFVEELRRNPNIKSATILNNYPGKINSSWTWTINGEDYPMQLMFADPGFVETLNLELVSGRNLTYDFVGDRGMKAIINESAVTYLNLENPVGTILEEESGLEIIGVVKDFNINSLHSRIIPMTISWDYWSRYTNFVIVKASGKNLPAAMNHIETTFKKYCPKYPFDYEFLDESFSRQYDNEVRLSKILIFFAFIAIFIAGLGLFGMSSYMGTTRIKEIGIRKSMGSTTSDIVLLFSASFIRWIVIAFFIAAPLAFYLIRKWLLQYPYRTSMDWWIFIVAIFITVIIALITIGYQVIKASRTNPADCLRYE